jgi:hypothetical protein
MKTDTKKNQWGLAFVSETSLPPEQTWREVPYFTYLINKGRKTYYVGKREDRPITIEAIESYPVLPSFTGSTVEIKMDETVFLDWKGNYFIGKKDSFELPEERKIIYRNNDIKPIVLTGILLEMINRSCKISQEKIYDKQYRTAC